MDYFRIKQAPKLYVADTDYNPIAFQPICIFTSDLNKIVLPDRLLLLWYLYGFEFWTLRLYNKYTKINDICLCVYIIDKVRYLYIHITRAEYKWFSDQPSMLMASKFRGLRRVTFGRIEYTENL